MDKIAIVAGKGNLPLEIAKNCIIADLIISKITGITDADFSDYTNHEFGVGELGKRFKALKQLGVNTVCFAGYVKRPDFSKIGLDAKTISLLPSILSAAKQGDDAIMRVFLKAFEDEGFKIIGPEVLQANLLCPEGILGNIEPNKEDIEDIKKASLVAKQIGALDIGQGCVVYNGIVLAVEAQEGTDEMLKRVLSLPKEIRPVNKAGVLCKRAKPIQETRVDLPTIGIETLKNVINANLKGIALEAGASLIANKELVIQTADENGIFIFGFKDETD